MNPQSALTVFTQILYVKIYMHLNDSQQYATGNNTCIGILFGLGFNFTNYHMNNN